MHYMLAFFLHILPSAHWPLLKACTHMLECTCCAHA